jgi:hypothetical protein
MNETDVDGAPTYDWVAIKTNVRCFLDLSYQRPGKDPGWTPEAGRPADRSGVLFLQDGEPLKPGDRVVITRGEPKGTFEALGALDTVPQATRGRVHHIEAYVQEVANAVS